ncbi:MAG TPA: ATP-binding protein [Parvibaculum sp.]|jgi:two-component system cell cycle sensor histidine kinase PleC
MTLEDAPQRAGHIRSAGDITSKTGAVARALDRLRVAFSGASEVTTAEASLAQLRTLAELQISMPIALPLLIAAFAASLYSMVDWWKLVIWTAGMSGLHLYAVYNARNYLGAAPEPSDLRYWSSRFECFSLAFSIGFSSILFFFWVPESMIYQNYVVSAVTIAIAPMTLVTICYFPVLHRTLIPMLVALAVRFISFGDVGHVVITCVLVIFGFLLKHLASSVNGAMLRSINLQSDKNALIEQLFRAKRDSDAARARAEEANRAKSHFLANMSHELRTPLNAIIGFSEVMATEIFGQHAKPIYKEYSNDINRSGQHLLGLINDILDLSRIEAGRFQIVEEEIDIVQIADEGRHLLDIRAQAQGVKVIANFEPGLPTLYADARAMRQIWINLLTNAIKFSPSGTTVTMVACLDPTGDLRFGVHDQGAGISETEIGRVTEAFTQGAAGIAQPGKGSGLGLSIVKGLLSLHGGSFEIRSALGQGTQAEAVFPMERLHLAPVADGRRIAG